LSAPLALAQGIGTAPVDDLPDRGGPAQAHATTWLRPERWNLDGAVNAIARSGNTIYVGGDFSILDTHAGAGVPVDRSTGKISVTFPVITGNLGAVTAAVADGAGGWFIGGDFTTVGGLPRNRLAHLLADGSVAAWDPGVYGFDIHALAVRGDTVYVGGNFDVVGGQPRHGLAAIHAKTGAVLPWDPACDGAVGALALSGPTLYVGGEFNSIRGERRSCLAAIDTRTGALTGWNPGAESYVAALATRGNVVYVGGDFQSIARVQRNFLAALDGQTGAATAWDPHVVPPEYNPSFFSDIISSIAATDRAIYVGGYFDAVGGKRLQSIAALDPGTGAALPWAIPLGEGFGFTDHPFVLAVAVAGPNVFVGGEFGNTFAAPDFSLGIVVVDARTAAPRAWRLSADLAVTALAPSRDRVFVGGVFRRFEARRRGLVAIDATTGALEDWNSEFQGTRVNALAAADTGLFVGGLFGSVGGRPSQNLGEIDTRTGEAIDSRCAPDGEVRALLAQDSRLYVGGKFTSLNAWPYTFPAPARKGLGAFELDPASPWPSVSAWDPQAGGEVDALVAQGKSLYVGGQFDQMGGQSRSNVAALDLKTGEATDWAPEADGPVAALASDAGAVYVGGGFGTIGGASCRNLAAVDIASGQALPWSAPTDGRVNSLLRRGAELYVGGAFQRIAGAPRGRLAAVRATTGELLSWDPGANGEVRALLDDRATVYAGGAFTSVEGEERVGLAALRMATGRRAISESSSAASRSGQATLQCVNNPVRAVALVDLTLSAARLVSLDVFDLAGRRVASPINSELLTAGTRRISISTDGWPQGCYFCELTAGGPKLRSKFVVVN
jgi:hypothetical protein